MREKGTKGKKMCGNENVGNSLAALAAEQAAKEAEEAERVRAEEERRAAEARERAEVRLR